MLRIVHKQLDNFEVLAAASRRLALGDEALALLAARTRPIGVFFDIEVNDTLDVLVICGGFGGPSAVPSRQSRLFRS